MMLPYNVGNFLAQFVFLSEFSSFLTCEKRIRALIEGERLSCLLGAPELILL